MLRFLQNLSGSFIVKFLLVLIGLSFIGWEFGNGFSGSSNSTLLTVNNQQISARTFSRELETRLQELRTRMGQAYSPELVAQLNLPEIMLEEKTNQLLLSDFAQTHGLTIANQALVDEVKNAPAFQDQLGAFSPIQYQTTLQNAGYSIKEFEKAIRDDLTRNYTRLPFAGAVYTSQQEATEEARKQNEERHVRILRFTRTDVTPPKAPTTEDLQAIYTRLKHQFTTAEERSVDLAILSLEEVQKGIALSPQDIKDYYTENLQSFSTPEKREVSHILINTEEELKKAQKALTQGTPFREVAKTFSQDPLSAEKGGSLGVITKEDVVPGFANIAFSLPVGEVSLPTKTPFGTHLIKVKKVIPLKQKPLTQVKDEIEKLLLTEKAQNTLFDAVEQFDEELSNGSSVQSAAKKLGFGTKAYTLKQGDIKHASTPYLSQILPQIFTAQVQVPSSPIEIGQNFAFFEVVNLKPQQQKPFASIQAELKEEYFNEAYERATLSKATQALTKRLQGTSFEKIAKEYNIHTPIETIVNISRKAPLKTPLISASVKEKLLALPQKTPLSEVIPTRLGAALYEVTTVQQVAPSQEEIQEQVAKLSQDKRNALFGLFMQHLRTQASIEVNQALLTALKERLLPQE